MWSGKGTGLHWYKKAATRWHHLIPGRQCITTHLRSHTAPFALDAPAVVWGRATAAGECSFGSNGSNTTATTEYVCQRRSTR